MSEPDALDRVPTAEPPLNASSDRPAALTAILAFSFSLGIGQLALPLLALAAGYDAVAIGLLTATSAISQFGLRLQLPALLGRVPDRVLISASCVMMAVSYGSLALSTALPVFLIAQLFQGGARALFWTASQTHAVRSPGIPVRSLAQVGAVGNVGSMAGPVVTGLIATVSLVAALWLGVAAAAVGALLSMRLIRLDPYVRRERHGEGRMWRRPGVDASCWAGFAGGGWRALMSSYVPVILTSAGLPPGIVGALMSAADLAGTATITALVRLPPRSTRLALDVAVVAAALGLAGLPAVAHIVPAAAILLLISGSGAGTLMTLGVATARELVAPDEEGEAIALVGTFRALALLVTPAAVAASLAVLPVGLALAIAGVTIAAPATILGFRRRA